METNSEEKPRQPETEKRVFEGNPFDPRDLSDWHRLQHVFLEDCYREFRMERVRITVEVLK